jgi:hypothetical protein
MSDAKPDFAARVEELKQKQAKEMQELLDQQANWDNPEQQRMRAYAIRLQELWKHQDPERDAMQARHKQERDALNERPKVAVQVLSLRLKSTPKRYRPIRSRQQFSRRGNNATRR